MAAAKLKYMLGLLDQVSRMLVKCSRTHHATVLGLWAPAGK